MSSLPTATESLQNSIPSFANNLAGFKLTHLFLNHRVQWFMLKGLNTATTSDAQLVEMWNDFFMVLYKEHAHVEDTFWIPLVEKEYPQDEVSKVTLESLHRQHETELSGLIQTIDKAFQDKDYKGLREVHLPAFTKAYVEHTMLEESTFAPLCCSTKIPDAKLQETAAATGAYFKALPNGAWMLLTMRDVADYSGDGDLWASSLSWFVRKVVAGLFLSGDVKYKRYLDLFGAPRNALWLKEVAKVV